MLNVFDQLLQNEALVDVTLACDGLSMKAHKVVLSACSPYFQSLFVENPCQHPIVFLKDVRYADLKALVDFMYKGEVNVTQEQLNAVLKTAESLKVKGLAEVVPPGYRGRHQGSRGDRGDLSPIPMSAASLHALGLGVSSESHGPSGSSGKEGQTPHQKQQSGGSLVVVGGSQRAQSPPLSPGLSPPRVPDALRRSNSPPAKRRKAKPRKRAPDNAFAIDPEDSDALDLTTGSPEMLETCMDMPDSGYDPTAAAVGSFVAAAAQHQQQHQQQQHHHQQHHQMYSERANVSIGAFGNTGGSGASEYPPRGGSSALTMQGLHVDIGEENGSQLDRGDSSSEGTTAQGSPAGMVTLRMPQLAPKSHQPAPPGTSVMATTPPPTPSTSATQASIQDIRRLCQSSRQSQMHKPTWTEEDMVQALEAVHSGRLTYALAARKFDIPKATLHYYVILMKAVEAVRSGRMTAEIAAIKYNVRTSILLDCLFGRQQSGSGNGAAMAAAAVVAAAAVSVGTPVGAAASAGTPGQSAVAASGRASPLMVPKREL